MKRDITIRIAGHEYRIPVESPYEEENLRDAAKLLDAQIVKQERKNVTWQDREEVLTMAALTISLGYVLHKRKIEEMEHEEEQLRRDIEGYLDNIDKYSR